MPNPVLVSLSIQHRLEMARVANMSRNQMNAAIAYSATLNDAAWARFIRAAVVDTAAEYAPLAAAIAAEHYDTTRTLWVATYGIQRVKSFAAESSLVMDFQEEIIEKRRQDLGFYIDRVFKGEANRQSVAEPARMVTQSAIADHDRKEQQVLSQNDDFAQGPRRVSRDTGCEFCQLLALDSYSDDEGDSDFHKGCSCSVTVEFDGGEDKALWQDWMYDFQSEVDAASEGSDKSLGTKDLLREIRAQRSNNHN